MIKKVFCAVLLFLFSSAAAFAGDYVIGDGDVLFISVWGVKELSLSVKVRPDGKITVPAMGDVEATGKTPGELQAVIAEDLKKMVKNPAVSVIVEGINNSKVYVFGGGIKSGVFDLSRRTTLLQLLCQIGDIRNTDLSAAYVMRHGKKVKQNFQKLFSEGDVSEDIVIEPNDMIYIPVLLSKNIFVIGAVNTPKFIEYREGLTVMEAILDAGGFNKFASQNSVTILRKKGDATISIPARVKDLTSDADLTQNLMLNPGDYIVVGEKLF